MPRATIVEVGLRDGLQNEARVAPTEDKLRLLAALLAAGVRELEVTSFVRPDLVPALADAEALVARLPATEGADYLALVGNERGYDRAAAAGVRHVVQVIAVTDAFNERNIRRSVARSLEELRALARRGERDDVAVRVGLAVSFGCPYSGPVAPARVVEVALRCVEAGVRELDVADTIGVATPRAAAELFGRLRRTLGDGIQWSAHFHDTRGLGLANVWAAAEAGVARFDASIAGLGGCPFAPGANGNVATEDTAFLLDGSGLDTGLDREGLFAAADVAEALVGRPSAGRVKQAERAARA